MIDETVTFKILVNYISLIILEMNINPQISTILVRAVHRSGRVDFQPNPDSTRRRRVERRSNPKPTTKKIGQFGFLWWLASVRSDRLPKLKKASKSEKSVAGI